MDRATHRHILHHHFIHKQTHTSYLYITIYTLRNDKIVYIIKNNSIIIKYAYICDAPFNVTDIMI